MKTVERIALIKSRLQTAFAPARLEVMDDSEQHRGHAGAAGGAGHYTVVITTECFKNISRVAAHQAIYQQLTDMIPHEIHALQIKIIG